MLSKVKPGVLIKSLQSALTQGAFKIERRRTKKKLKSVNNDETVFWCPVSSGFIVILIEFRDDLWAQFYLWWSPQTQSEYDWKSDLEHFYD